MAGYDSRTLQELGGWAELAMVQRYAHLSPSHKAEAVERITVSAAPENSTTVFTTPSRARIIRSSNRLKSLAAPVAQVDRAAVS